MTDNAHAFIRPEGVYVRELRTVWRKSEDTTVRATSVQYVLHRPDAPDALHWLAYLRGLKMAALVQAYTREFERMVNVMEVAA